MSCTVRSGSPGASTSPPRPMRRTHHGSRKMLSCGPHEQAARSLATRPGSAASASRSLAALFGAVVVALGPDRRLLAHRLGGPRRVDVAGRDEREVLDAGGREQGRRRRDVGRLVARRVDGRVPGAALERVQVAAAVADEVLRVSEQIGAVAAAVEHRHLVAAGKRLRRHVTPEEHRAAEDEESHDAQRISCASETDGTPAGRGAGPCEAPGALSSPRGSRPGALLAAAATRPRRYAQRAGEGPPDRRRRHVGG